VLFRVLPKLLRALVLPTEEFLEDDRGVLALLLTMLPLLLLWLLLLLLGGRVVPGDGETIDAPINWLYLPSLPWCIAGRAGTIDLSNDFPSCMSDFVQNQRQQREDLSDILVMWLEPDRESYFNRSYA